jgi:hypothetical protein
MSGTRMVRLAALVLGALLLGGGRGQAESFFHKTDCPKPSYSPLHYWVPSLYRANACIHGPKLSMYAPDRAPGLPARVQVIRFPCPAADPATFYSNRDCGR